MKTTIDVEDKLFLSAAQLLGTDNHTTVINAALQVLVERESTRRLARLGGTDPTVDHIPRRQPPEGPMQA